MSRDYLNAILNKWVLRSILNLLSESVRSSSLINYRILAPTQDWTRAAGFIVRSIQHPLIYRRLRVCLCTIDCVCERVYNREHVLIVHNIQLIARVSLCAIKSACLLVLCTIEIAYIGLCTIKSACLLEYNRLRVWACVQSRSHVDRVQTRAPLCLCTTDCVLCCVQCMFVYNRLRVYVCIQPGTRDSQIGTSVHQLGLQQLDSFEATKVASSTTAAAAAAAASARCSVASHEIEELKPGAWLGTSAETC